MEGTSGSAGGEKGAAKVVGEVGQSTMTAANQPLSTSTAESVSLVDRFLAFLASDDPPGGMIEKEWRLHLVELALGRDEDAEQLSEGLPAASRELMRQLLETIRAVRPAVRDPEGIREESLGPAEALASALADRIGPTVGTVALCRKVLTFGVYEEMDPTAFQAGVPVPTIVYSEIERLRSERTEEGRYRTRLATRIEVLSEAGEAVWTHEEPEITDECRRRRRDFFVAQRITLPATIPAGRYVLKVRVEDKLSGRVAEGTTPLTLSSTLTDARGR
ncbi:MAG: hypothetical protein D6788_01035 [Planctomycetota bacterium]|nr:MAG: hypothetical protein D6788_01035 [Planctomycetota bacterium]